MARCFNIVIVGAGIVGLMIARELIQQGQQKILILDKEMDLAQHGSGRNSGVLHAGIYYSKETLKAQFCIKGNRALKQFCYENDILVKNTGKVIVCQNAQELQTLNVLHQRACENGAKVALVDEKELLEIEPFAKTYQLALYSYETAVVDPVQVMQKLHDSLLKTKQVTLELGNAFLRRTGTNTIQTARDIIHFDYLINAAGGYADRVAHAFDVGREYSLVPFKGLYRKLRPEYAYLVRGNIYPVPNIHNPFLGVHLTRSAKDDIYAGPTAIPAFGPEHYGFIKGMDKQALRLLYRFGELFVTNKKFRAVALCEPKKYLPYFVFRDAQKLVKEMQPNWLTSCHKVGIRAQLVNWNNHELVMDFLIQQGENSLHILNAISPAFTCSIVFAQYVVNQYCAPFANSHKATIVKMEFHHKYTNHT